MLFRSRNQAETGIRYEWYAMQRWGANYWEDFLKPKIIFQEIVQESQFFLDENQFFYCNDTCRIITGKDLEYLVGIFNSKLFFFAVKYFYSGGMLGGNGVRMKHTFFEKIHCPSPSQNIIMLVNERSAKHDFSIEKEIDNIVYKQYNLNEEEIDFIENREK